MVPVKFWCASEIVSNNKFVLLVGLLRTSTRTFCGLCLGLRLGIFVTAWFTYQCALSVDIQHLAPTVWWVCSWKMNKMDDMKALLVSRKGKVGRSLMKHDRKPDEIKLDSLSRKTLNRRTKTNKHFPSLLSDNCIFRIIYLCNGTAVILWIVCVEATGTYSAW